MVVALIARRLRLREQQGDFLSSTAASITAVVVVVTARGEPEPDRERREQQYSPTTPALGFRHHTHLHCCLSFCCQISRCPVAHAAAASICAGGEPTNRSEACRTRARAPSSSARSPSTPGTTSTCSDALAIA